MALTRNPTLTSVTQNVLDCRDLNHHWTHEWTLQAEDPDLVERVCSCPRCGTVRHELVSKGTGETINRRYAYPGDFHVLGARWTRRDYRKENIRRSLAPKPKARRARKEVAKV